MSNESATTCAFIGLGNMRFPMAGHLATAGHTVRVFNRTRAKAEAWAEQYGGSHGGSVADTPAAAAEGAEFVFTCVGNDDDLRQVVAGAGGAFESMAEGAVLADHTTTSAEVARELATIGAEKGLAYLDAPVSGGQAGAENGVLTVMVGGDEAVFERTKPVMDCYSRAVTLMGPVGNGQLTKMVNQITIAGLLQGLSEALNFSERAGLDSKLVLDVISKGAASSWQMENRGPTMVDDQFDFGFAVDWLRKDLNICIDESRRNGARLPVTALVNEFYAQLQARGKGRWDTSSLIHLLKQP
ncbi:MAG: NAD(P)-dependent oxidoreductase [Gammaproteobacteria bacterium]